MLSDEHNSRSTRSESDRRVCLWWITWIKIAHLTSATWRVRQREIFQLRIWDQREMSLTFSLETSLKFNLRSDTNIMEITSKFVIKYRTKLSTST